MKNDFTKNLQKTPKSLPFFHIELGQFIRNCSRRQKTNFSLVILQLAIRECGPLPFPCGPLPSGLELLSMRSLQDFIIFGTTDCHSAPNNFNRTTSASAEFILLSAVKTVVSFKKQFAVHCNFLNENIQNIQMINKFLVTISPDILKFSLSAAWRNSFHCSEIRSRHCSCWGGRFTLQQSLFGYKNYF